MNLLRARTLSGRHPAFGLRPAFSLMVAMTALTALVLTGCSSIDDAVNRRKTPPDEFQVVIRPPLTLPPNFKLRPGDEDADQLAAAGSTRLDISAVGQADALLTKGRRSEPTDFDSLFGTERIQPDIRSVIDEETLGIQLDRRIPLEVLFGGQPEVGPDLDAGAEAYRIRQAIKDGKPLTDSPSIGRDTIDGLIIHIE